LIFGDAHQNTQADGAEPNAMNKQSRCNNEQQKGRE